MAAFDDFDATTVDPKKAFEPIPSGWYPCVITDSEEKQTASGAGTYHQFTIEVIDGPCKGRKTWARLNLKNPSDQAVSIARAELSAICHAVGVMKPKDSVDLHNLPMMVHIVVQKRKDTGELTNQVKDYKPKDFKPPVGGSPSRPPATGTPPSPSGQTTPTSPPWKRR